MRGVGHTKFAGHTYRRTCVRTRATLYAAHFVGGIITRPVSIGTLMPPCRHFCHELQSPITLLKIVAAPNPFFTTIFTSRLSNCKCLKQIGPIVWEKLNTQNLRDVRTDRQTYGQTDRRAYGQEQLYMPPTLWGA